MKWFGYKLPLIFDAAYELPVMFIVTNASESDINEAHRMLVQMEKKQPTAGCFRNGGNDGFRQSL